MQYRHAFHAGNFADVHKHIALGQLIDALQKKAKGFLYLDTHAGEGAYDLRGADSRRSDESATGITRLEAAASRLPEISTNPIRRYLSLIARLRHACGEINVYPGSPLLAVASLREVDSAVCVEAQASAARALQRAFDRAALAVKPRVQHGDGYHEVRSQLPPPTRRGLVLIDPPYESRLEDQHVGDALAAGLERFETGVFAVWYPIKKRIDSDAWLARVLRGVARPAIALEFWQRVPDNPAGLNGSGLLVINAPWEFETGASAWQQQLETLLGATGGSRVFAPATTRR